MCNLLRLHSDERIRRLSVFCDCIASLYVILPQYTTKDILYDTTDTKSSESKMSYLYKAWDTSFVL